MMDRRDFVRELLIDRRDLLVVCGLGSATYDVAAAGDHPLNFYLWGAMGGAAMIGLGLALAQPGRRVAVITGDGDMLMGFGSLATIGVKQPKNLVIVVLDNAHYGETGMQPSHTDCGVSLAAVARACGFAAVFDIADATALDEFAARLARFDRTMFARVAIRADEPPRVLPSRDGVYLKTRFRRAIGAE
jgi:thiamine pyrophosphate-dependent acetolactate synthase large subunit-like protein